VILRTGHPGEIQVNTPALLFGKGPKADFVAAHGQSLWDHIKARYHIESSLGHALYEIYRDNKLNKVGKGAADLSKRYYDYLRAEPDFVVARQLQEDLNKLKSEHRRYFKSCDELPPARPSIPARAFRSTG
jgi:hypothetical protein